MKVARDGRFVSKTSEIIEAAAKSLLSTVDAMNKANASYEDAFRIRQLRESCGIPAGGITINIRPPVKVTQA
jgi:hypothetical protein